VDPVYGTVHSPTLHSRHTPPTRPTTHTKPTHHPNTTQHPKQPTHPRLYCDLLLVLSHSLPHFQLLSTTQSPHAQLHSHSLRLPPHPLLLLLLLLLLTTTATTATAITHHHRCYLGCHPTRGVPKCTHPPSHHPATLTHPHPPIHTHSPLPTTPPLHPHTQLHSHSLRSLYSLYTHTVHSS
jgi:hypothetical protein